MASASDPPEYLRFFPYDEPYDHQTEAMGTIYDALDERRNVLFEGATGTGKTLAALAPALEYARETNKTVVITTNVHQQMRQFVREAAAITDQEPIRAVVFQGKASMCHIDVGYEECQALRDTTRELVDAEENRAELESQQRALLEESQDGSAEAADARGALMDELDSVEDEIEQIRTEQNVCDNYYRNLTVDTDEFYGWLFDDVRTPEDVYGYAEREGLCGYELLKEGMDGVDLVVCNYHHLLDPMIREQFFRWLGRDPEDVIAVFDEAHNVEDAARDHARRTLTETTLDQAVEELETTDDPRSDGALNVLDTFRRALTDAYQEAFSFGEREGVEENWYDLSIDNEDARDELTLNFLQSYSGPGFREELDRTLDLARELDQSYEEAYKNGETTTRQECQTLQAASFVEDWLDESAAEGQYPVVSVRRAEEGGPREAGEIYGRAELYTCIPSSVTEELFADMHASVLMSATLRPFDVTEDVLGLEDPATLAYGPQFPEERRRTYAVDGPALFASKRDDMEVQSTVAGVLEDAARFTPGNTLAFFPSYSEAERYHQRVDTDGATYLDRPGTSAADLREAFTDDDGSVLFTSLWGTLAEGVSFDGDDARTVVVVGVPYPHLDDRMDAVQEAYDAAFGDDDDSQRRRDDDEDGAGWRYGVEIPTVRKTRQALGRVVRSPEDFGARILLDKRYTERSGVEMRDYSVRGTFPPEERREMVDVDPGKLKFALLNFYQDVDGYDGEPPRP
ncbi:ATP-dependent DNA helicase [Halosimplex salinum]|uniref:ATP-dependent DNA helicase n=1 Tax=Halosimplex salinum TaxID=1710538 RepID=UPI0022A7104F|nr:ATP-dependent DNA helicase [Halosimplex salinum]